MIKKNILLLFILLSSFLIVFPQDVNKAFEYFDSGQYEKAAIEFEKSLPSIEKKYGTNDTSYYSKLLFYTAVCFERTKQFNKAEIYYLKAKTVYEINNAVDCSWYSLVLYNVAALNNAMGNYEKAELLYLQVLQIDKKALGENRPEYVTDLNSLAGLYIAMGNYKKAEPLYLQALQINKKSFGEDRPEYATCLNNLALMYKAMGNYKKAEPLYLQALQIRKKVLGEEHHDFAVSLNNLAVLYKSMGNYEMAESMYLQVIEICKKALNEEHPDYATALDNLADLYGSMGNYEKAEPLFLRAMQIRKKVLGEEHSDYATSLNNLAILYRFLGNYEKAEHLYLQALQINKKVLGEEHSDYAISLSNLAELYKSMGNYEKAESLFLQAIQIEKKVLGEEHPFYATSLSNLGELYRYIGNYEKAELLSLQSIQIKKKVLGEEHPFYANSLSNLAALYQCMGNYEKAESLFLQAIQIEKKVLGEDHLDYATSLNNLAILYRSMENYEKAEPLYLQALQISKKVLGGEHPSYATSLNNLAILYRFLGNYEKAEHLYLQALQINKKVLGEEHPDYAISLSNLAELYRSMENYELAEPLFQQALQIEKKALGEEHPNFAILLFNLAELYSSMGKYEKAEPLIKKATSVIIKKIELQSGFLSEIEMARYLKIVLYNFNFYQCFFLKRKIDNPFIVGESYNIELITKAMLLNSGIKMRQGIINSGDTALNNTYNRWTALRKEVAKQYTLPNTQHTLNTKILEEEANDLEKHLVRSSQVYAQGQQLLKANWNDVKENLNVNEAAIGFASFDFYNGKRWTDSIYYLALVLRKNDEYPKMVYLCEEKQLDSILNQATGNDAQKTEKLYTFRGIQPKSATQSQTLASRLYDFIWRPIDSLLSGVNTIYFSPTGLLHKISFSAIATPDSMCLLDKYKLVQLGSTAEIVRSENKDQYISVSDTTFVCGGINYDQMRIDKGIEEEKELFTYNRGPQISKDSTRSISWSYLPGTYKEARYIDSLFRNNKISTALYSDSNATETMFKNLSGKEPQVIHVSTHGFFFPEPKKEKPKDEFLKMGEETYRFSENPLLRSGLIFAGANYVWKGGEQTPGQDDGILTAYEVSNMNLYNTKLVVLSACETGLGDIKGSEGVFGLQRAFKMAGVDYIIMSLWKVPDKETTEFMKMFYSNCLSNHSIRESFYLTQTTMRKKYNPYYWAAFVLME